MDSHDEVPLLSTRPVSRSRAVVGISAISLIGAAAAAWTFSGGPAQAATSGIMSKAMSGCTASGNDCQTSQCCQTWGEKCYRKNQWWSACMPECDQYRVWTTEGWKKTDYKVWDCTEVEATKPVCTHDGADCSESKCCASPYSTCYRKNEHWASCNRTCTPNWLWVDGSWQEQSENHWACDVVPRDGEEGHDLDCEAKAEENCYMCSGEQCEKCRWDERITCCQGKDSGLTAADCCAKEGVPSWHTGCGGSGTPAEAVSECQQQADDDCRGCGGEQCVQCDQDAKMSCCLDKKCYGCGGEQCARCYADNAATCCAEEGIPSESPKCSS